MITRLVVPRKIKGYPIGSPVFDPCGHLFAQDSVSSRRAANLLKFLSTSRRLNAGSRRKHQQLTVAMPSAGSCARMPHFI